MVVSYCSMIAGPSIRSPASSRSALVEPRGPAVGLTADVEDHLALERHRARRVAVAALQALGRQVGDLADRHHADVDELDIGVEVVAVLGLVGLVEAFSELGQPAVVDLAGRNVEADLVALADVAAVGQQPHHPAVLGHAVLLELPSRLDRQVLVAAAQPVEVGVGQRVTLGGHELVVQVGRQQPGGGHDPRVAGHEHAGDLELDRDVAREQRAGTARGDQHELARVIAAADRVELDRLGHSVLLDLQRAERGLLD